MSKFFQFANKKILPGILTVSLTVLTIGSSILGVGKVAGSFSSGNNSQSIISQGSVQGVSTGSGQVGGTSDRSAPQSGALNPDGTPSNVGLPLNSGSLLAAGGSTPIPTAGTSGACIVVLFGKEYNITNLLVTHSGGNVFSCGTDMTAMYQSRHGTDVTRMIPYLISGTSPVLAAAFPTPTSTPIPTSGSTPTPSGSCIVTLFGKQYNVTNLRNTHSGPRGSFFTCGGDMSSIYQGQHGTDVSRMQGYLVSGSSGGGSTPTPPPTGNPTPNPTNPPSPTSPPPSGACIVTLFGIKYDVSNLRNTHSGPRGTFFVCGGDMSSTYQGQHGTNMTRMQPYLVVNPTPTPVSGGGGATPTPTKTPTPTPTPTSPPSSGTCIVTLFGIKYDVTNLRNTHSGPRGTFFVCGGDMSSTYQGQHGTNMTRMQPYLVTSSGGGTTPTPAPTPLPTGLPPTPTPTPTGRDD